jgi:peptidoglycan/LPS O-acetylase OafA/YrhL
MDQTEQNSTLYQKIADDHVDYSEMYRTQETIQLNKRLRKTRNILLICGLAFVAGAGLFWIMPETSFTTKDFLVYLGLAVVMILLSFYSNKHPFFSIVSALVVCIGFWGFEIFLNNIDELVIETSIHKLFIVSILVWCFHSSKEAELIRKELHFS